MDAGLQFGKVIQPMTTPSQTSTAHLLIRPDLRALNWPLLRMDIMFASITDQPFPPTRQTRSCFGATHVSVTQTGPYSAAVSCRRGPLLTQMGQHHLQIHP